MSLSRITIMALICALLAAGCAKSPDSISGTYVSPLIYQSYTCDQLGEKLARVAARASEVAGVQSGTASGDAVAVGVGLVLFWPALFFISGSDREAELSRLRGEVEAIEKAAIQKDCGDVVESIAGGREASNRRKSLQDNAQ